MFPILESMAAWMTDANPKFDVAPVAQPNSFHYAKMDEIGQDLKTCLNAAWDNQGFAVEIQCAVFDALTYHIGIAKAGWDCHILHGLGMYRCAVSIRSPSTSIRRRSIRVARTT